VRKTTRGQDNIKTWTGLPMEESIRMAEDRDKWRKYVHVVAMDSYIIALLYKTPWCGQPSDRGPLKNRTEHMAEL